MFLEVTSSETCGGKHLSAFPLYEVRDFLIIIIWAWGSGARQQMVQNF